MTYTRHSAYRHATAMSWTRIDMLLALYDATLLAMEQGLDAVRSSDAPALLKARARCLSLITELVAGVDVEQGSLPENVHRLLTFCLAQTSGKTEREWSSAVSVLNKLRAGFYDIRDQAAELEQSGQIPALHHAACDETLAVG